MNKASSQPAPCGYSGTCCAQQVALRKPPQNAARKSPSSLNDLSVLRDYEQNVTIRLQQFTDLYGNGKIGTNNQFLLAHANAASWRSYRASARRLTSLMLVGAFGEQNWLELGESAQALAWSAADYDLLLSYTDVIGEICFKTPIYDSNTGITRAQFYFALDTSSSFLIPQLLDGLVRSTSDERTELPFGFTYPEYVLDGQQPIGSVLMPRYYVSVGHFCALKLRQLIVPGKPGAPFNYSAQLIAIARYRILLLMWLQNQLYQTMLPEPEQYGRQEPMLKETEMILDQMDGILRSALDGAIAALQERSLMPSNLREKLTALQCQKRHQAARDLVKDWQLRQAQTQITQLADDSHNCIRLDKDEQDTFVQLVYITQRLLDAAYAGRLDHLRAPRPRNRTLPPDILKAK